MSIAYKPLTLPSDDTLLKKFVFTKKAELTEQVIDSIEYAVDNQMEMVEVFVFEGSDFIVTLNRECFLENVENIYKFYVTKEKYELCNRVKRINLRLLKKYEK